MRRAVVLLSGGLDSAYNLYAGIRDFEVVLCLTFDYGQRAASAEIRSARRLAETRRVPHKVVELPWFKDFTATSLINRAHQIPVSEQIAIDDMAISRKSAEAVWVPNRNGIFLNIAAGFAEGLGASVVLTGFNLEEGATFPDNTQAYLDAVTDAFTYSTANKVKAYSYCASMSKTQIVRHGREIGLPLKDLWPCYFDGDEWCGTCESCQRFARAVRASGGVANEATLG